MFSETLSNIKSVLAKSYYNVVGQTVVALLGFFSTIILTTNLSKDEYGSYKYILMLLTFFSALSLSGLNELGSAYIARKKEEKEIFALYKLKIISSLIGSVLALILSVYYLVKGNELLSFGVFVIALLLVFYETLSFLSSELIGRGDYRKFSYFNFIGNGIPLLVTAVSSFVTNNSSTLLCILMLSKIILFSFAFDLKKVINLLNTTVDKKYHTSLLVSSGSLTLYYVLTYIIDNFDKLIVWNRLGPESLATYFVLFTFIQNIVTLFSHIAIIFIPEFSRKIKNNHDLRHILRKVANLSFFLLIVSLAYNAIIPLFFHIFFPKYHFAELWIFLSSLFVITWPIITTLTNLCIAIDRPHLLYIKTIVQIIFISLIYIFIAKNLTLGAVLIYSLLSQTIQIIFISLSLIFMSKKPKYNIRN